MNTENVETNEAVVESVTEAVVETSAEDTSNVAGAVVVHADVASVVESVAPKAKGTPGRKPIPNSGLQRALSIYTRMAGAKRSDVVSAIVADGVQKASANTYYHLIKNGKVKAASERV